MNKRIFTFALSLFMILISVTNVNAETINTSELEEYTLSFETHTSDLLSGRDTLMLSADGMNPGFSSNLNMSIDNISKDGRTLYFVEAIGHDESVKYTVEILTDDHILPLLDSDQLKQYESLKVQYEGFKKQYEELSSKDKGAEIGKNLLQDMHNLDLEFRSLIEKNLTFSVTFNIDDEYMSLRTSNFYTLTGKAKDSLKLYSNPWMFDDSRNIMDSHATPNYESSKGNYLYFHSNFADTNVHNDFRFSLFGDDVKIERIVSESKWNTETVYYDGEYSVVQEEGHQFFRFLYTNDGLLESMGDATLKKVVEDYRSLEEKNALSLLKAVSHNTLESIQLSKELYDASQNLTKLVDEYVDFTFDFINSKGQTASITVDSMFDIYEQKGIYFNFTDDAINLNVNGSLEDVSVDFVPDAFEAPIYRIVVGEPSASDEQIETIVDKIAKTLEEKVIKGVHTFSISPQNKNFEKVQLKADGSMQFTMKLPEGMNPQNPIQVYHLNSDGTYDVLDSTVDGSTLTFTINSFSDFMIVESETPIVMNPDSETNNPPSGTPEENPQTPPVNNDVKPEPEVTTPQPETSAPERLPETGMASMMTVGFGFIVLGLLIVSLNRIHTKEI